jgi:hypothetical protein
MKINLAKAMTDDVKSHFDPHFNHPLSVEESLGPRGIIFNAPNGKERIVAITEKDFNILVAGWDADKAKSNGKPVPLSLGSATKITASPDAIWEALTQSATS